MNVASGMNARLVIEPRAILPGIATVAIQRQLAAPIHGFDRVLVALHLGSAGWMDWHVGHDAQRLPVSPGSLSLAPAGTSFWWCWDQPLELVSVELEPSFVADVAQSTDVPELRAIPIFHDRTVASILSALQEELQDGCRSGRRYSASLCTALVIHLLRRYPAALTSANARKGGLPPTRLRRVLDHIEHHLGDGASLGDLAALAGLSPDHFAAQFRRSTGLPPHRYLLQRRIGRARELLATDCMSLAEIGYVLGFPSQAHFTTAFRKQVGTTPGAYRNSHPGYGIAEESRNLPLESERRPAAVAATIGGATRTLSLAAA
jgi:AraC family transcriptional regulator